MKYKKLRFEILYSVLVMVFIPAILVVNTVLMSRGMQSSFDTELRQKADLANAVFGEGIKTDVVKKDYTRLDETIQAITTKRPDLSDIEIAIPDNSEWRVVASSIKDRINKNTTNVQYEIVRTRKQSVATLVDITTPDKQQAQAWRVVSPLIKDDQIVAIMSASVSTVDAENVISSTLRNAFIVLVISVIVVILLLLNHYRFVGYVQLLDKQRELNQLMSDFLSVATHELKAPMAVIKGNINNIEDGVFGEVSQPVGAQLKVIEQQTDRLNNLINDLLNVSRIEQGKITYNIENIDATKTIADIVAFYKDKAGSKGITIHYDQATPLYVQSDAGRLQEIFTNLIDNAVKYTVEAKDVFISHEQANGMVITRVRDGGIGIDVDEQKRLFQRFYRVQNERTQSIGGTGLGLWIIKKYIEAQGGRIEVSSMKDAGTEFTVYLKQGQSPQINEKILNQ